MDVYSFLVKDCWVLVPALWAAGRFLKSLPFVPNWSIPFLLLGLAVPAACVLCGWSLQSALQGLLATAAAVYSHEAGKQIQVARGKNTPS